MILKKLSLNDFDAISKEELLEVKGGRDTGGCAGDPDGFGGTYDMGEVVLTGGPCYACADRESPRSVWQNGWGTLIRDLFMHRSGCPNAL
ncbi:MULTISPECIES: hypothetical protein [unclassified Cellulophaga]|uniref:hypothetical protein n=1 Tax=unclassified Cellulophaga TaxID=2634405 RepID=UPI0026E222E5|nr:MULTISPECIES: hypothetical protein [unclassified Cellulophaga]MDO6492025.1 hypothetical protein [Cellulophaga sp. 2_MG-2023]MDO6495815.1 hypothetical protein [Cellulophaga sp. 3_MG-2023]